MVIADQYDTAIFIHPHIVGRLIGSLEINAALLLLLLKILNGITDIFDPLMELYVRAHVGVCMCIYYVVLVCVCDFFVAISWEIPISRRLRILKSYSFIVLLLLFWNIVYFFYKKPIYRPYNPICRPYNPQTVEK